MTDWDVKKAFQIFEYPVHYPTIYIDEYWDYYMQIFGIKDSYINFKTLFKEEFKDYDDFRNSCYNIAKNAEKKLFNTDISSALKNLSKYSSNLPDLTTPRIYDFPDGNYLIIDLHSGFDAALKTAGVFNTDYDSTKEILHSLTDKTLLWTTKQIRINTYFGFLSHSFTCFKICAEILNKICNSNHPVIQKLNQKYNKPNKCNGDCIIYNIGNDDLSDLNGDYEIDGFSINMSTCKIKTVQILNQKFKIKLQSSNKIDYNIGYSPTGNLLPQLYPLALSLFYGKEPTEKDLAIGCEDKIYFYLNKNDYEL